MNLRFDLVTLDVLDSQKQQRFWSAALDLIESECEDIDRWVVLSTRDGIRRLGLQRGTPRRGTIHLDLACKVDEFESELARLIDLGAVLTAPVRVESYGSIANLADPEGNLFDLCAYVH